MANTDLLVIGGGIVGLSIALEAKKRDMGRSVTLIDKENACGLHASSRNSGVLHAGFYYPPGSLKARFTVEGNRRLTAYCAEHSLPINKCGKLVVTRTEDELPALEEMNRRATANACPVHLISAVEARDHEPRVRTVGRALFSPTTSSVSPARVVGQLLEDVTSRGVRVRTGCAYRHRDSDKVVLSHGASIVAGHVVNAAGLYADVIAKDFGFADQYVILPFKGVYLVADQGTEPLHRHIYPVPDLSNQFHLGLHFTVTVDGTTKIGPTAMPAFWREQYDGLQNFKTGETLDVLKRQFALFRRNDFGFRRLALQELRKYSRRHLVGLASELVKDVRRGNFRAWGRPGIRAQLFDSKANRLVSDFVVEGDEHSTHILNAVSPAFTCCFPFAEHVLDRVERVASR